MEKKRLIKIFEGFNKDQMISMVSKDETYVRKKNKIKKEIDDYQTNVYDNILFDIINYNYSKFKYVQSPYGSINIYPDIEFMNLYRRLCDITNNSSLYNGSLDFYLELRKDGSNLIEFSEGIPEILRGSSVGYNLYKLVLISNKYLSSNKFASKDAYNLWYTLLSDRNLYAITSKEKSSVIIKNITNDELKEILENIKSNDLIFDDDLTNKIVEIYGSLENYLI